MPCFVRLNSCHKSAIMILSAIMMVAMTTAVLLGVFDTAGNFF